MSEAFKVAIHYDNDFGHIEYSPDNKEIRVVLADVAKRKVVEEYLTLPQVIHEAQGSLCDFKEYKALPSESLHILKLVLTRLWQHTGVYVDWSRPVA